MDAHKIAAALVRDYYDRAMENAGLADFEIAIVNEEFDKLITKAAAAMADVVDLSNYRK